MDKEFFMNANLQSQQQLQWQSQSPDSSFLSNDNLLLRELIGKLGNICNSGDIATNATPSLPHYIGGDIATNITTNNSSILPSMSSDLGFAERAARFSSFGSKSFNGRTTQFGVSNIGELCYRSNNNNLDVGGKFPRVSSSPSLKIDGSQINEKKQLLNSELNQCDRENSSISGGENRKRKSTHKGKTKGIENGEETISKRSKSSEDEKTEENREKQNNSSQKPPEPPKDYIHVRARRGQATDSHSLAERVRREKISERMKLLQDLVPGCNKVTGKALMLDEIINYVQSLQRQVEFLSMKLASVNPRLDFNVDNLFSKDVIQPNCSLPPPMYQLQSMAPNLYRQNTSTSLSNGPTMSPFSMDPLNSTPNQNHSLQLPPIDGFVNGIPQLSSLCEGDLQSIVQMSYSQNENEYQSQQLHGSNQTSLMKIKF